MIQLVVWGVVQLLQLRYGLTYFDGTFVTSDPEDTNYILRTSCYGYELAADIDAGSMTNWEPIGPIYTGAFNGNGYIIKNLTINRPADDYVGLFARIQSVNEYFRDIGLVNVSITGNDYVGGIAGDANFSYLIGTFITGSVIGRNDVGGMFGRHRGILRFGFPYKTHSTSNWSGVSVTGNIRVGGLFGYVGGITLSSPLSNSYSVSTVLGDGGTFKGSFLGQLLGTDDFSGLSLYFDVSVYPSGGAAAVPKSTIELQTPTGATGIYTNWGTDRWHYGTSSQYPGIKYTRSSCPSGLAAHIIAEDIGSECVIRPKNPPRDEPIFTEQETLTFRVSEFVNTGIDRVTSVGRPLSVKNTSGYPYTISLSGTSSSNFSITTGNLLMVADGVILDFETTPTYTLTVSVTNGVDQNGNTDSSIDDTITVIINVDDEIEPPTASTLTIGAITSTSITVSWEEPLNRGPPIIGYDVKYNIESSSVISTISTDGDTRTLTIFRLIPNTVYTIIIESRNDEGTSPMSIRYRVETSASVPLIFASDLTIPAQQYFKGIPVSVTLPAATGGDGAVAYTLSPAIAGLSLHETTHILTGTPTNLSAATQYTYTATDEDGDTTTLTFSITVVENTLSYDFTQNGSVGQNDGLVFYLLASGIPVAATGIVIEKEAGSPLKNNPYDALDELEALIKANDSRYDFTQNGSVGQNDGLVFYLLASGITVAATGIVIEKEAGSSIKGNPYDALELLKASFP